MPTTSASPHNDVLHEPQVLQCSKYCATRFQQVWAAGNNRTLIRRYALVCICIFAQYIEVAQFTVIDQIEEDHLV